MKQFVSTALVTFFLCGPVFGQQDTAGEDLDRILQPPPSPSEVQFSLSGGYEFGFGSDFDTSGDLSVSRFDFTLGISTQLEDNLFLQGSVGYGLDSYDFGGVSVFGATEPWEDIHMFSAAAIFSTELDNDWQLYGGPFVNLRFESGADIDDGLTGGGFLALSKPLNEDLTLGGGFGWTSQIEESGQLFPIIAIDWKLNDEWRLATLTRAYQKGAELIWQFDEGWETGFGVTFGENRFRLDDDGVAPDGVGEDSRTSLTLRLARDASPSFRWELVGGVNIGGELDLENSGGSTLVSDDYEMAPFLGIRGRLRF